MSLTQSGRWIELAKILIGQLKSTRLMFSIFVVSAVAARATKEHFLGLDGMSTAGPWIGLICLASGVLLILNLAFDCVNLVRKWLATRKTARARQAQLEDLTEDEKFLLRGFIRSDKRTRAVRIDDPYYNVARALAARGILGAHGGTFDITQGCPFTVQPWAWDSLGTHPEFLD